MFCETVRRKSCRYIKPKLATRNHIQNTACRDSTQNLRHDVSNKLLPRKPASRPQPNRYCGIQMGSGNVSDRICHGQDGQSKGKGHTKQTNSNSRKGRGKNSRTAAAQYQPERSKEFGAILLHMLLRPNVMRD